MVDKITKQDVKLLQAQLKHDIDTKTNQLLDKCMSQITVQLHDALREELASKILPVSGIQLSFTITQDERFFVHQIGTWDFKQKLLRLIHDDLYSLGLECLDFRHSTSTNDEEAGTTTLTYWISKIDYIKAIPKFPWYKRIWNRCTLDVLNVKFR